MKMNWPIIISFLGMLLMINGLFMALCLPFSLYYEENTWMAISVAAAFSVVLGFSGWLYGRGASTDIRKREGYLIVTLGWLSMSIFGMLPYLFSGAIPVVHDAFFETMSGYTTTGATILTDIEALPKGILLWRSVTHWIGGMGIIVLTVAILPLLGIGGMQLFMAESPGITPEKLHPRITATAKRLWLIYFSLTVIETVLLMLGGMSFYQAINHALSNMATGGFSPKNGSIADFPSPYIQYVIMIFMFLAGTNFTLTYFGFKGKLGRVFKNEEFRAYLSSILVVGTVVTLSVFFVTDQSFEKSLRDGFFQVLAIITTTGFVTADYTAWISFTTLLFFILFFMGGSTGSTAGGVKMMRHLVLLKNSIAEFKRQIHPSAILPVRFNGRAVSQNITYNISAFVLIYFLIFFGGSLIIALTGLDFMSSIGSVAACVGNIGPAFGSVGPVDNYAHLTGFAKWFLSALMLIGRLELFTVLILLTPFFWSKV